MRYFKLVNADGKEFDITTVQVLFHDIEGLGFEEEAEFRSVGPVWRLNKASNSQLPVSGKLCFTEIGSTTPYQKYDKFRVFISRPPLILKYFPHGIDGKSFNKRIRVTKLSKTELTKYGVLDCDVSFTPYTPWYEIVNTEIVPTPAEESSHFIWDAGNRWRDFIDGDTETPRYKFGVEPRNSLSIVCDSNTQGFIKLTIDGPARNPTWTHYVDGKLKSSGSFSPENTIELSEYESLIIDNTEGAYSMIVYDQQYGRTRNVYSLRDFDKMCFFNLEGGNNVFAITSEEGTQLGIHIEGHIHYATV